MALLSKRFTTLKLLCRMKNICTRCRRYVFQPEEKSAFGKLWHSFCFSCYICNKLLDCTNVQIAKEDLYCTDCFFRLIRIDDDDDDQCPSEQCIQSLSSRVRSTDDLKAKYDSPDAQNTSEVIYPCSIPVPYSVSGWYNRQHQRRLLSMKRASHVSSHDSYRSATTSGVAGQESECTCPPSASSPPSVKEMKPNTSEAVSKSCKRSVNFDHSNKEQKSNAGESCQSKVSASASPSSSRHSGRSDESRIPKQRKLSSTTHSVDCHCSSFKPIEVIKAALQRSVMASLEPKHHQRINAGPSATPRSGKYGRHIPLGGGLDCRRCGRKVYFAEMFMVPGAVYHDICFCCLDCRRPLEATNVHPTHGDIYCKLCYIRNFGPLGYGYGQGSGALFSPNP